MATTTRDCPQSCPYFCCSAFRNVQDRAPTSCTADLKNEVHPIFAKDKFPFDTNSTYGQAIWNLLEPSLKLASRFLTMETTGRHMLTVVFGDVYLPKSNDELRRGKKATISDRFSKDAHLMVYPKAGRKASSQSILHDADLLLDDLKHMVEFEFTHDLDGATGTSVPLSGPLDFSPSHKFPFGCRTLIFIDTDLLNEILFSIPNSITLRKNQFQLAKILCHELGHALTNAAFGERDEEPFVMSRWCSEAGFDMEAAIFGGTPFQRMINSRDGPAEYWVLDEWPSDAVVRSYLSSDSPIGLLDVGDGYTRLSRLTRQFIVDLFQEKFWVDRDLHRPSSTLRPLNIPCWIMKHRLTDKDLMGDDSSDDSMSDRDESMADVEESMADGDDSMSESDVSMSDDDDSMFDDDEDMSDDDDSLSDYESIFKKDETMADVMEDIKMNDNETSEMLETATAPRTEPRCKSDAFRGCHLRVIEHDDDDVDEDTKQALQVIIRRRQRGMSFDELEVLERGGDDQYWW